MAATEPTTAEEPTTAVEPTTAEEPTSAEEPADTEAPDKPHTGDNSCMLLWIIVLLVSAAAFSGTRAYEKKH